MDWLYLGLMTGFVLVSVALTYGTNRFRATGEAALAVLAAIALDALVTWLWHFVRPRTPGPDCVPPEGPG